MLRNLVFTSLAALALSVGAAHAAGDAAKGEKVFRKCKACHDAENEKNKVGPHLVGIIGRPAGTVDGFKYSDAMANSGITWDAATIDAYIAEPKTYVEGNRMAFPGLKKEEDRADVIAYLESLQ
ncbi:MAG: cytochrome c family protein [Geminicoccaceae bacterium]|nr:cytochrome c family protein [Geminicoccaceae bacterium]